MSQTHRERCLFTDPLGRRNSKSGMTEQGFAPMDAGQAYFLSGFSSKKTKRVEGNGITAKKM